MKLRFLIFILFIYAGTARSQETFRRFAVGAGGGLTTNSSDLKSPGTETMFWGSVDFFVTKYFNIGAEMQKGALSGNENTPPRRYFRNDYKSLLLFGKIRAGQLAGTKGRYVYNEDSFFKNMVNGIYLGSGCGILSSDQVKFPPDSVRKQWSYTYYGVKQNKEVYLPVMAGVEWYAGGESHLMFSIGVEVNFVLGDNMDGYLVPGSKNDVFSTFSAGIKYTFGKLRYF